MFVLSSEISIGDLRFSGVSEVSVSRSIHSIMETAIIKVPSVARITKKGKVLPGNVVTGNLFSAGDPVIIKLGYYPQLRTEFKGFIVKCKTGMPLEIECEGYSYLLKRNNANAFYEHITVKALLEQAVTLPGKESIRVVCDINMELSNIRLQNANGYTVITDIAKYTDGCLTCFFTDPQTLWCGLIYTAWANGRNSLQAGGTNYRQGYNTLNENSLVVKNVKDNPIEVTYQNKLPNGNMIRQTSDAFTNATKKHSKILSNITDEAMLKTLANEKAYMLNYTGYEGNMTTFLDPYITAGSIADITDRRYPDRDGKYLVEGTQTTYGIKGARRVVEPGPELGFAKTIAA